MNKFALFKGTWVYEILTALDGIYKKIERSQKDWKEKGPVQCPEGCGTCCTGFEPDVLDCEALYLAAWILSENENLAQQLVDESFCSRNHSEGCILFDPDSLYHCTVYGGRCLICRIFGYSGDYGKHGETRWRPCHFISDNSLRIARRQYTGDEMQKLFGTVPPVMSEYMEQVLALSPDCSSRTRPLREALPDALKELIMLLRFGIPA